jgi:hypothetical protein
MYTSMLGVIGIAAVLFGACFTVIPPLLRKRCPGCARRSVASHGFDQGVVPPKWFRVYECVRCRIVYASADGRSLIPKTQWDAGVRDAVATASVVRRR